MESEQFYKAFENPFSHFVSIKHEKVVDVYHHRMYAMGVIFLL